METEIWKDIKGYDGLYQISNLGRVKSFGNVNSNNSKERILKPGIDGVGYLLVILFKDGKAKTFRIHRLVAKTFIPNIENLPQVNHKDEIKTNNCVENLEWCTAKYNINYSKSKRVICVETNVIYESIKEADRQTCISQSSISKCCLKKRKTAGKLHWKFVD